MQITVIIEDNDLQDHGSVAAALMARFGGNTVATVRLSPLVGSPAQTAQGEASPSPEPVDTPPDTPVDTPAPPAAPTVGSSEPTVAEVAHALGVMLDSAGVPWDKELHSSNGKKYDRGEDKGRWQWKRGINRDEALTKAAAMAEDARARALRLMQPPPESANPAGDNTPPPVAQGTMPPAGDNTPPPMAQGTVPPAGDGTPPPQTVAPVAQGQPEWTWIEFLQAMGPCGVTGDMVVTALPQEHGITQVAELAHKTELLSVAAQMLGMKKVGG